MANEATKLTIGGVQHDIKDAEARRLIALLQAALDAMTGSDTTTAIETFQEVLDFLAGVTDDETLVGKITALQTAISGKVDKENGKGLSTNDYTTAEKQKLAGLSNYNDSALQTAVNNLQTALANVYTKKQTDDAIQEAVDGLGGGSVESVTINGVNHTPNSSGVVDLGTVIGQQGPQGNVAITDAGQIVTIIENNLDSSDGNAILSARQGKILKQAISTVQANLQAVVDALANMAFTSAKPNLSQIDWTGGTFYVSISKSLTGVNDTNDAVQVAENSPYTNTLTPQSGLTMKSVVVTMGGVDITSTAYNAATGVISIAQATGNIVITALAEIVVNYNVRNHLLNMTSSNNATQVDDGDDYTAVLSPTTGATSNDDLRVFVDGTPLESTDYTFDSATGALTIPAAKITGDVDVCATASTGKITVTVKAGMSTTVEFKQNKWTSAFYSDTIDASESAEDVTVVIDTVPKVNGIPTVTLWTFGTIAAIKSIDFGGCKTHNSGNHSTFYGLSGAESITGLAYVETPNNAAVSISDYFKNCSSLKGTLDLMTWRCDTMTSAGKVVDNCTADEIIMPYMPNHTQLNSTLAGCKVKRAIFNKTGVITQFRQVFGGATDLEYVDMSKCPVHIGTGTYDWYMVENNTTNTFTLKIGEFEMDINPSGGLTHVGKLICTTTTPPGAAILGALSADVQIYVPNNAVDAYKTAWASKASNIHPVSDYTE